MSNSGTGADRYNRVSPSPFRSWCREGPPATRADRLGAELHAVLLGQLQFVGQTVRGDKAIDGLEAPPGVGRFPPCRGLVDVGMEELARPLPFQGLDLAAGLGFFLVRGSFL